MEGMLVRRFPSRSSSPTDGISSRIRALWSHRPPLAGRNPALLARSVRSSQLCVVEGPLWAPPPIFGAGLRATLLVAVMLLVGPACQREPAPAATPPPATEPAPAAPAPAPTPAPVEKAAAPESSAAAATGETLEAFKNDPLIKKALEIFAGEIQTSAK